MLKHILSTSIALVLSTAAIAANAADNDYTGGNNFSNFTTANDDGTAVPADKLQLQNDIPKHHFVPKKTQPATEMDNSQPATFVPEKTQPATEMDNSQPATFVPEKTQPATEMDNSQLATFVPEKTQPATEMDNSQLATFVPEKTQPATEMDNSQLATFVPEKTQPAHNIQPQDSVPMTPMHHGKIPVYEGLGQGYRADIEVNLDKCQLDGNSPVPQGISLDSLMVSSRNGAKLTLDPNGNAQTVYHFSHEFHEFTSDLTEHSGTSFIEVGPKTTRAVVKVNIDGTASTYQYNCSNSNVTFQPQ